MTSNPFPGPQPYRASDRARFYGREELSQKLEATILATRCVTVHGPSGAGKSSLVQAAVLPALVDAEDVRIARVDSWPEGEDPARWLAHSLYSDLELGEPPPEAPPGEAVLHAVQRAARASSRLMIVYLDQIEQLFFAGRSAEETEPFFECLQGLAEQPLRSLRVVLSLREDYLGRFRDRLRDRGRMLDSSFRVGPLTVAELTSAVCQAAAAGEPPQRWSEARMRELMLQVRLPGQAATDEAEAQSAYAQIVCRALFQQRAQSGEASAELEASIEAEPILRRYLEAALDELGELGPAARRLLEDHLVSADGSRTLRTEKELLRVAPRAELSAILKALEGAAILHAEEHQGSRYFEIGHDWLARKVFEERQEREAKEEQRRREEEQRRELERQQAEAAKRLARARRQQRALAAGAGVALAVAAVIGVLGYRAFVAEKRARIEERRAQAARLEAVQKRVDAKDQSILAGYLALAGRGERALAMKLLPEVKYPERRVGWLSYAGDALGESALEVTLRGHTAAVSVAVFDREGKRALTASSDWDARVWSSDGAGAPLLLEGHTEAITAAAFSPDGQRALTVSADGTARVWRVDGKAGPVELKLKPGAKGAAQALLCGAFSPDGQRVAVAGEDRLVRVYGAGGGDPVELGARGGHTGAVLALAFLPDGKHLVSGSADRTARVWDLDRPDAPPVKLGEHKGPVLRVAVSGDGAQIVTTSGEALARLFAFDGKAARPAAELRCARDEKDKMGQGEVVHAAISPDGKLVATACSDRVARVFTVGQDGPPIRFEGAASGITSVAFSPDGQRLAAASLDGNARVHAIHGGSRPLVLQGHGAAVLSIAWSPGGERLLTASADRTAKIWSAGKSIGAQVGGQGSFHAASLSADGALVVTAHGDTTALLQRTDGEGEAVVLRGHERWVANASLSPDGERVVTAGLDGTARIHRADGKGEPLVLAGHKGDVRFASFSADGKRVVTASEDGTAMVWDAGSGAAIATLSGHEDWLTCAAFSRDGARVVTASHDRTARVWSADGKGQPVVLRGHAGAIRSAAFDRDGKRVVTASDDGTVRVWSADGAGGAEGKGEPVILRGRGEGALLTAVWSADGERVAAPSIDGFIHVWSARGAHGHVALRTAPPDPGKPPAPALALAFVDGGQSILAVLDGGAVRRWRIDAGKLAEQLRSAHKDCLPPEVRVDYLSETGPCAAHAFAACEHGYGRRPAPPPIEGCGEDPDIALLESAESAPPSADAPPRPPPPGEAPAGRWVKPEAHVKVIVLPGDALVEIGGVPVRRWDGVIELSGKRGEVKLLRVSRGDSAQEQAVTIVQEGSGAPAASPPVIVKPEPVSGKLGERELKAGEGDFSALIGGDD